MANEHQDIFDALGLAPTDSPAAPHPEQVLSGVGEGLGVNDLLRAVRSGRPENMIYAGGMLGINALMPGARAEKAATAAAPLMKDLFPQSGILGKIGHMTPSEYVASYGDAYQFSKTFPESFKVIEPHLNEDQKLEGAMGAIKDALTIQDEPEMLRESDMPHDEFTQRVTPKDFFSSGPKGYSDVGAMPKHDAFADLTTKYNSWLDKEGLPKVSMDEHNLSKLTKTQQDALGQFQDKWNSVMSNQLTSGPSSRYSPGLQKIVDANADTYKFTKENALGSQDFPHEVPFDVPPRAQELGFTTPGLHGTPDRWGWEGPMDQLRLPDKQLGVHFGNPSQAAHFSIPGNPLSYLTSNETYAAARPRTYPAVLQMHNPLETRDMGSWGVDEMKDALNAINAGEHKSYVGGTRSVSTEHKGMFPPKEVNQLEDIQDVRNYLADKGFDSIKYTNSVEDPGHTSYIMFQGSPVDSRYVAGVRSPFAKFDPKNLHLPSLAASGAGVLAFPLDRSGREEQ